MKQITRSHVFLILTLLMGILTLACSSHSAEPRFPKPDSDQFSSYWYKGKAEVTRYRLNQARYGEIHDGDAVLIFVTEPFLDEAQVKRDFGEEPAHTVLKLNATRKFNTGIYPYSLMTSVFTDVDFQDPGTSKVTFSAQEWCGHTFMQLNYREEGYKALIRSYFQSEGDQQFNLPDAPLEDSVWTQIRIAPNKLPLGDIKMIPSLSHLRLHHKEARAYEATAILEEKKDKTFSKERLMRYRVTYPALDRRLDIYFEKEAPHRIMGWRELGFSGSGEARKKLQTEAVRTHEMLTSYWGQNTKEHTPLRKKLGLK